MKLGITIMLIFFSVLLGGCQIGKEVVPSEMHPSDLPDERAFQDEFTREFLQSVEETRPGYYPFLSKTGKYKMDFPADAVIGKQGYTLKESHFEALIGGIEGKMFAGFTLFYHGENDLENIEIHLDWFQGRIGKKLEYEVFENDHLRMYYKHFQRGNFDKNVAYVQNLQDSGSIEIIFTVECTTFNDCNESHVDRIQQDFLNWIKSIKFINEYDSID